MSHPQPLILMDSPEDGYCESTGWVEATVPESVARGLIEPWCVDEDGESGTGIPEEGFGRGVLVYMAPDEGATDADECMWHHASSTEPYARVFWEFQTA